ncbi:hypothetical protein MKW94_016444 [Papaver nudicaule]|uniref:Polymerase nucleotidyl transferase domain-containing protein n=1 Tax=Papaver nudicaule TaxID=74823 RepID=A0AA41SLF6_PAPNU|nr:hypothetical protein [Papaver nudicaule]
MGHYESWAQPNGLLPNEAAFVTRPLERERWMKAEDRTAELIACIQPNHPSEDLRNAVADYVQRLIMKCFTCQVFTFGSVPLKTYLPDGDIDLTAFSDNPNVKDTWANEVRIMLENEEKSDSAEFRVKEVQYIQAEVKIIKCLVENIVVDISFNQLGGLCTLCFLEEVDHLINQNHLFKRSIILIKAWCYYESRILGAHHGLISTYALETLVLYIFHVFNNSFAGPLEVLYRFLEFFSNFDWDNFCLSLWGPIPITALPDMTAESPRKDTGDLLLKKPFLNVCTSVYAVVQNGQENQGPPFVSKHFNVVDPLRTNNNLGRSVSKGNFFRIRSAFAFGAKRLARLLDCPKEDLIGEVNLFFLNTWDRHGNGRRPDTPSSGLLRLWPLNPDPLDGSENLKKYSNSKMLNEITGNYESETGGSHAFLGVSSERGNHPSESVSRTSDISALSRNESQKIHRNVISSRGASQDMRHVSGSDSIRNEKVQRLGPSFAGELQGKFHFARTRSSPELSDTSTNSKIVTAKADFNSSRRNNLGSDVSVGHIIGSSTEDPSSLRDNSSHQSLDDSAGSNSLYDGVGLNSFSQELTSADESIDKHQEEQDLVNMMASSGLHGFPGHIQMPMHLGSPHLPFPVSPAILASMGYGQRNFAGMAPTSMPFIEPPWGTNIQFRQGMVSSPMPQYFPNVGMVLNPEEIGSRNGTLGLTEINHEEGDYLHEHDEGSTQGFESENESFKRQQSDNKQSTSTGNNFVSSSQASNSGSPFTRDQQKFLKENRGFGKEETNDNIRYQTNRQDEVYFERNENLRTSHASSSRSTDFGESTWDESSMMGYKSSRDKRGRKASPSVVPSIVSGRGKPGRQYEGSSVSQGSSVADDDSRDWIQLSTAGSEMVERSNMEPTSHKLSVSGSDSMIPVGPMFLGSGSHHRGMNNGGTVPFAFYPTGPPVPFITMLPMYNFPNEASKSEGSSSHFDRLEGQDSGHTNQSDQNFDPADISDQSDNFNSIKGAASLESFEENKADILHSDFASHWQNLQYGRLCQYPPSQGGPLMYPSPVAVPPVYLQGNFPWDGPGRPVSGNVNLVTQVSGYGPRLVPVAPLQPSSSRPAGVYQRFGDEAPRYRGGTGTYLPNPKISFRDQQTSSPKNYRGNHSYDRNDHYGEREGSWNINSRPRAAGRSHGRNQAGKPNSRSDRLGASGSRSNRPWDSYRHGSFTSYQSQAVAFGSPSLNNGSNSVTYGMYPIPAVSSNGGSPTGSVVMVYPYGGHSVDYGSPADQLEFGSLRQEHFSGINEVSQRGEGVGSTRGLIEQQRFRGGSKAHSSPDQPSSPQLQR